MRTTAINFNTPKDFNFWNTVNSHGWCSLLPFSVNKKQRSLDRLLTLSDNSLVNCCITEKNHKSLTVRITGYSKLTANQLADIKLQISSCLRLTENFSEFYQEVKRSPKYRWIAKIKAGRMLRAPSVFEDIVKMICTINCSWSLTEIMTQNLAGELGESFNNTLHSFPSAEKIAGVSDSFLRKKIKAGYRSPFLLEFAENVAKGVLDVESWRTANLPTDALIKSLRSIKGVGEYSAANILKLLGRYDYLGLDSWVRNKYYALYHHGRKVTDKTIERNYGSFGKWRGIIFWMEMTKDWYESEFPF